MSHQVPWCKVILETFISEGCLTEDEEMIMRTRVAGWTRIQQSMELGMSLSSVDRLIKSCKDKYDNCQRYNPILPPRKNSDIEMYLDSH